VAATVATTNLIKTPVYGQNQAPSTGRVIGANDRIIVAYVGVGGQGMAHVRSQKAHASENNIAQAAVCDLWQKRVAVDSMNAGKHVYVEKPMTRYLGEAFEIYDTVKKTGKILQVGSQGCSDAKWHKAAELIRAGKIGPLVMCQGSYMRNKKDGEWNYAIDQEATPETLDWERWLG